MNFQAVFAEKNRKNNGLQRNFNKRYNSFSVFPLSLRKLQASWSPECGNKRHLRLQIC